ncbi:MAG: cadmium-translocating P-type ATPase [Chitinophagaceae bacterium]|uniref:heavy metal translocating P-type ATPase n=1 Tax=unclassified Paraflavitalea TaxID=2798305 RepID=UPI003D333932|nr:cadmium-translocating P-type ATPase [Chitinophagaceae bacterium]
MEKVFWKVDGMTCANCALTVSKFLEQKGLSDVKVNLMSGEVSFDVVEGAEDTGKIKKGIDSLGYKVVGEVGKIDTTEKKALNKYLKFLLITAGPTLLLMLHMIPVVKHWVHFMMNPWIQFALCLPVYGIGMYLFAKSAWVSVRNKMPNMNVLVTIGATSSFAYSVVGMFLGWPSDQLFFETTATIVSLILLGNFLEDSTLQTTQRALTKLSKSQKVLATMIAYDDQHQELHFQVENNTLRSGDLILIKSGEQVPADCRILSGSATVNEAIVTGESLPISKTKKDTLIGGSIVADGLVKAQVTSPANESVLANIINLVKQAQGEKPPVQQLADKISAIFVPVVLVITALTFILNYLILHNFTEALMRSVAVLVIACPCAMGLATPAAIAVGLGRAARSGILFRNAKSLELFKNIRQVVFDKTGTLTTGTFEIKQLTVVDSSYTEDEIKKLAYSLEKFSNHPIALSVSKAFTRTDVFRWKSVEEIKGKGVKATDIEGNEFWAGSYRIAPGASAENAHNVYIVKNNTLLAWIDVKDLIRPEAAKVVSYLHAKGIKTILLSGDTKSNCTPVASELGIDQVIAEQTPEQKLAMIEKLNQEQPTAMVGDGINDAPALAKATIGISMSEASQVAIQTADVVLMNKGLGNLPLALGLGKHSFITIQQNLFWAFSYNIIAIPVAAFGLLGTYGPTYGALIMGLSDVVLAVNSVRLFVKKVV